MAPNLHRIALACALGLPLGPVGAAAQISCPPAADSAVRAGWSNYRQGELKTAGARFAEARRLCPSSLDAQVGLGFVALRQGRKTEALSTFRKVVERDSANVDGWDGLAHAAFQSGDPVEAARAARTALALNPQNGDLRKLLDRVDPDWDRPPLRSVPRLSTLRVDARARSAGFEVATQGGWRRFFVKGVNLGVALPNKYPSEFPLDSALYARWFELLAGMNANTVRLYTILPPQFYRALRGWNLSHPDRPLWLVHGVWAELPPENDFDDAGWKGDFHQEMRRVVDLMHGMAEIPARPGHAGGRYDADVSPWGLAYIIGREWEPFAVKDYDARHPGTAEYRGRFLEMGRGPAMDRWLAEQCDYLLTYEVETYNTIRPAAYTNWPTLDPLRHPTEASVAEELAWRKKVGREVPGGSPEYENDAIGLDAMLIHPTKANPAGWFASYHAYPYYPDFMLYDPGYSTASAAEGRSNYFGYLEDLVQWHRDVPVLIAEYGVPSSRGMAHLQPQGWHHGGHDELAMARIDARLTREIQASGAAGAIIFAWLDEWFKKNWVVIDYEIPLENTRKWHNMMDAEQNYGILGMYAGDATTMPVLGGDPSRWLALPALANDPQATANLPRAIRVGADEAYLYLAVPIAEFAGRPFPGDDQDIIVALDTYRPDLGQHTLPDGILHSDLGFEFVAIFRDTTDAELRITPEYNPYVGGEAIVDGDDFGRFARRPVATLSRHDGRFDSLFVITNRSRFARNGDFISASGYNRGRLRFGTEMQSTLSDWYWDRSAGMLELRLPWNLINVSDPSTCTLLFDTSTTGPIGSAHCDGFRIGVAVKGIHIVPSGGPTLIGALPKPRAGDWRLADFPSWTWKTWEAPQYHEKLKPVYDSLRAVWGGQ